MTHSIKDTVSAVKEKIVSGTALLFQTIQICRGVLRLPYKNGYLSTVCCDIAKRKNIKKIIIIFVLINNSKSQPPVKRVVCSQPIRLRGSSRDLSPTLSHAFKPIAVCHSLALKEPFVLLTTLKRVFVFFFSQSK